MDKRTTSPERVIAQRHAEGWMFLLEAARDIHRTGAIAPSSPSLARALTDPVRARGDRPVNVLEAGAGTGAVTRTLIPQLAPGSLLDIAETNPRFTARLHRLVHTHPHLAGRGQLVRIHARRVEDLELDRRYDVILSGLPFANFTPAQVQTIMDRYLELLKPGGNLTYFAYLGSRQARSLVATRAQARRHQAVEEVLRGYQRQYATGCWTVWSNLPPARVWQLTRPPSAIPGPEHTATGADR